MSALSNMPLWQSIEPATYAKLGRTVFLGMRLSEVDAVREHAKELSQILESTCSTILVRSGEVEDILDTESTT